MSEATIPGQCQLRVIRRRPVTASGRLTVKPIRPSLMETRLAGDPWVVASDEGGMAVCFDDWQLAAVAGSPLDLSCFNRLLDRLRSGRPPRLR